MKTLLWTCLWLMVSTSGIASAEQQIRLKDGTTVSGTVLEKDATHVIIGLPRASVASVNGRPLPEPVAKGARAPAISAVDLNGATHTVGAPTGKAVLVQFWATWCPHCRNDVPLMEKTLTQFNGQPFSLVSISVDRDREALAKFVKERGLAYPVISAYDPKNTVAEPLAEQYEIQGIPAYYLVDADGRIAETWSGSLVEGKIDLASAIQSVVKKR